MSELSRRIRAGARRKMKRIVLADGEDARVIEAAKKIVYESFAKLILLGSGRAVEKLAGEADFELDTVTVIEPSADDRLGRYAQMLREPCGISEEAARRRAAEPLYFGMLLVKTGAADGLVCGSTIPSAEVMRAASELVGTAPGCPLVSSSFLMNMRDGRLFSFSDCAVNALPEPEQIAEIAYSSAQTFERFAGEGARVAMLSYATHGAGAGAVIRKMREAEKIAKERYPHLYIGSGMQLDEAINDHVANIRIGSSGRAGRPNVLIFPDISSGAISCRLVQRLTGAKVIGPIINGLALPVNDLSEDCTAEEIVDAVAVTAVQSQNNA